MPIEHRVKFRHLQCFLAVAEQRSVVRAALALSVTQPAVSKTIGELEQILGVTLFERRGRGVAPTRYGEVFLRFAGASITALKQGIDSVSHARSQAGVTIKVGALPTVSSVVMPLAVQRFKAENVGTTVEVVTGGNAVLLSELRTGGLDLVVGRLADPERMTGLSFEHLYSERVAFIVRTDHPLLKADPFKLAEITQYPVLMPTEGSIIRPMVERLLIANGIASLPDTIETVSMAFGRQYTRMTDAVWIISRGVAAQDIADGILAELPVATETNTGSVGLTTRSDAAPSVPALLLMQAIRELAAPAPAGVTGARAGGAGKARSPGKAAAARS